MWEQRGLPRDQGSLWDLSIAWSFHVEKVGLREGIYAGRRGALPIPSRAISEFSENFKKS